jgi:hypothetical protein
MGTTGHFTQAPTHEVVTEEIEWHQADQPQRHKVIKRSGKFYAVKNLETGEVSAVVAYTSRDSNMVYTKLVDEDMGPYDYAPNSILDVLTPLSPLNDYAVKWRQKSREYNAAKAAMPKVKPGDTIKFAEPIKFSNGVTTDTLTFVKQFTFNHNGWRFRLGKNWKTRYNWEVVT